MGNKHQAFVVARVVPHGSPTGDAKYRCIAVYQHHWCYGRLPLRALRRFLTLVKQPDNAEIVRAEVRAIHGKYGRHSGLPKIPDVPCPFVAALLGEAWTAGGLGEREVAVKPYTSGITFTWGLLGADMGPRDGGDSGSSGFTIIDVTDPAVPAYCFSKEGIHLSTAEAYVRSYYPAASGSYPDEHTEEDVLATIRALDGEKLITPDIFGETWDDVDLPTQSEAVPSVLIPTLADISMQVVFSHGLQEDEVIELEKFLWHPGKAQHIHRLLRRLSPFPDYALPFLSKTLVEVHNIALTTSLDLSDFDLTAEQVLQLFSLLPRSLKARFEALNLSFNNHITADTIRKLLSLGCLPVLNRLVLMGCLSILDADLCQLLREAPELFYGVDALMHRVTLSVQEPSAFPPAFTYLGLFGSMSPGVQGIALPVFTLTRLLQNLIDVFVLLKRAAHDRRLEFSGMGVQAALSGKYRLGQTWAERSVVSVPVLNVDNLTGRRGGWMCLSDYCGYGGAEHKLAFVRSKPSRTNSTSFGAWPSLDPWEPDYEIYDVRGFVDALVAEGRPPPPEELVTRLANLVALAPQRRAEERMGSDGQGIDAVRDGVAPGILGPGMQLLKEADIQRFVKESIWSAGRPW